MKNNGFLKYFMRQRPFQAGLFQLVFDNLQKIFESVGFLQVGIPLFLDNFPL